MSTRMPSVPGQRLKKDARAAVVLWTIGMMSWFFGGPRDSFADRVYFKNGKTLEGHIVEQTEDVVTVQLNNGSKLDYLAESIERIVKEGTSSTPPRASEHQTDPLTRIDKSPTQVFEETAPAVVVVTAQLPVGGSQGSGFIVHEWGYRHEFPRRRGNRGYPGEA